jgi:hypothetical protein
MSEAEGQRLMREWQAKYEKMTPEQKVAMWDSYRGLDQGEWVLYSCTDCDPEFHDEDEEGAGEKYERKFQMICRRDDRPDYCPRCLSYLSLSEESSVKATTGEIHREQSIQ